MLDTTPGPALETVMMPNASYCVFSRIQFRKTFPEYIV
jgi:hypothetical protein